MTAPLPDRLRADADTNTVSGDSGFSNEVMRDLQYTAGLEREAADALLSITQDYIGMCDVVREKERQLAGAKAEMRKVGEEIIDGFIDPACRCNQCQLLRQVLATVRTIPLDPKEPA